MKCMNVSMKCTNVSREGEGTHIVFVQSVLKLNAYAALILFVSLFGITIARIVHDKQRDYPHCARMLMTDDHNY